MLIVIHSAINVPFAHHPICVLHKAKKPRFLVLCNGQLGCLQMVQAHSKAFTITRPRVSKEK
jgi:hypothetical protein